MMQSTQSEEAWTPLFLYCFLVLSTHNLETRGAEDRMCNLGKWETGCVCIPSVSFMCLVYVYLYFGNYFSLCLLGFYLLFFAFPWLLPPAFNCFLLRAALTCVLFPSQCAVYVQSCLPVCPLRSSNLSPLLSLCVSGFSLLSLFGFLFPAWKKKVYLLFLSLCGTKSTVVASHTLKYCRRNLWCLCFNFPFPMIITSALLTYYFGCFTPSY